MKVVALHNLKGGVGKTTAAVHLAHLSARTRGSTLLWDLDAQGAASWVCRVTVAEKTETRRLLRDPRVLWGAIRGSDWPDLDVLPADLSVRKLERALGDESEPERVFAAALEELGRRYERVVLDCPAGLNSLTQCVFHAADALVVPTIPTPLSLRTLATLHHHLKPLRRRGLLVLPFFSMLDSRRSMHRRVRAFARAEGLGFLAAEIPHSAIVESSAARREPLTVRSDHPLASAFVALQQEIEERLLAGSTALKLHRGRILDLVQSLERSVPRPGSVPDEPVVPDADDDGAEVEVPERGAASPRPEAEPR